MEEEWARLTTDWLEVGRDRQVCLALLGPTASKGCRGSRERLGIEACKVLLVSTSTDLVDPWDRR